jgi:hypothetical protein
VRRGYRPTRPASARVTAVDGVVPDEVYDAGIRIVWDTVTEQLFRYVASAQEWQSVSGKTSEPLAHPSLGGYEYGYSEGY